ncbi:MAG: hypothetical protein MRZ66_02675 [Clostridiales bacterium]|nr:hypothetical protein [Clostridiales bacterium]
MKKQKHVSIRTDSDMLDKFYYVSRYNGRSGSGQILFLMRSLIEDFEKDHGEITADDIKEMYLNK